MLQIVIPMAGRGSRFSKAGYDLPKPLIRVHGIPMIEVAINNLRPRSAHRFIFICQQTHLSDRSLADVLEGAAPNSEIISAPGVTAGAACTVLLARDHIANDDPLMIANCDQWINASIDQYLASFDTGRAAGLIMTMTSSMPKWSYIQRDEQGEIVGVVEKQVVSNEATVGIYNFARGIDFVNAAEAMILDDDRTNGEFYVAPTYTRLIQAGGVVEAVSIGSDQDGMYGLGTPEDLEWFVKREQLKRRVLDERTRRLAA